jgi:Ribonuclease G/E
LFVKSGVGEMKREKCTVLVGTDPFETRVVVLKNDILDQFFIERTERGSPRGNIYCGRVAKVIPGIRAAFIDAGLERSAFLPATQVVSEEFLDAAGKKPQEGEGGKDGGRGEGTSRDGRRGPR